MLCCISRGCNGRIVVIIRQVLEMVFLIFVYHTLLPYDLLLYGWLHSVGGASKSN